MTQDSAPLLDLILNWSLDHPQPTSIYRTRRSAGRVQCSCSRTGNLRAVPWLLALGYRDTVPLPRRHYRRQTAFVRESGNFEQSPAPWRSSGAGASPQAVSGSRGRRSEISSCAISASGLNKCYNRDCEGARPLQPIECGPSLAVTGGSLVCERSSKSLDRSSAESK